MTNLDLDLIQCEKDGFGCSYGKWKATQGVKVMAAKTQEPKKIVKRICANCGKEFVRTDNRPCKYCCDRCRVESNYIESQAKIHNEKLVGRGGCDG